VLLRYDDTPILLFTVILVSFTWVMWLKTSSILYHSTNNIPGGQVSSTLQ